MRLERVMIDRLNYQDTFFPTEFGATPKFFEASCLEVQASHPIPDQRLRRWGAFKITSP